MSNRVSILSWYMPGLLFAYNTVGVGMLAEKALSFPIVVMQHSMNNLLVSQSAFMMDDYPSLDGSDYVPKTARGRRIMELRKRAKEAGEAFYSSSFLLEELRKNRE